MLLFQIRVLAWIAAENEIHLGYRSYSPVSKRLAGDLYPKSPSTLIQKHHDCHKHHRAQLNVGFLAMFTGGGGPSLSGYGSDSRGGSRADTGDP